MRSFYMVILWVLSFSVLDNSDKESYIESIPGTEQSIKMVGIPAGSFMMGSPETEQGRAIDEGPMHKVELNGFWMSEVEITWDVFRHYMERTIDAERPPTLKRNGSKY